MISLRQLTIQFTGFAISLSSHLSVVPNFAAPLRRYRNLSRYYRNYEHRRCAMARARKKDSPFVQG